MLQKIIILTTIVCVVLLSVLIGATTPATAGPFGILTIFITAYLSAVGIATYVIYGAGRLIAHLVSVFGVKGKLGKLSFRRAYYYSTVIAAAPILLIGLQSVGAVGIYEFLLVVTFVVIGCLYITKIIR